MDINDISSPIHPLNPMNPASPLWVGKDNNETFHGNPEVSVVLLTFLIVTLFLGVVYFILNREE